MKTIKIEDIRSTAQIQEIIQIIFTILAGNKEVVTELTVEDNYLDAFPDLNKIARTDNGEDTAA